MRHMIFHEADHYPVALLIKGPAFARSDLQTNYIDALNRLGVPSDQVIGFTLEYNDAGKAPVKIIKNYLDHLLPGLDKLKVEYLYVADSNYFKVLAGVTKTDTHVGYVMPCKVKGFEHMKVVLGLNHQALIYNPDMQSRLDLSLNALASSLLGSYQELGCDIIKKAEYPDTLEDIANALDRVKLWSEASCDIEGFSLSFNEAGIATISFGQDQEKGLAFACDYEPLPEPAEGLHGEFVPNLAVRRLLRDFFETYTGKLIWHGSTYDLRSIIYALWMNDLQDYAGMLQGLEVMTRDFDDTMIITYLATNSCAGNQLGLKTQAHEYAGNWAQDADDIKDVRRIPLPELLQYNLVDSLCTHYVRDKHWQTLVDDQQLELYKTLMLPSLKVIIQMELVGMPMDQAYVAEAREELEAEITACEDIVLTHPVIETLNTILQRNAMEAANAKLKIKQHPIEAFADTTFNMGSDNQLRILLYEVMELPVLDWTKGKQPATGADTIEKLINHTTNAGYKQILAGLIRHGKAQKILSSFIPAFEKAIKKGDGTSYLHGSFKLGGTVSGRLSSSKPNMQNLPSGSVYGKLIKKCFRAPEGWLMAGADFASLEDRINALLTKDPNKIKVYVDGYDGHCLRAFAYFPEAMPDIVDTVASINSIKKKYEAERQDSKTPTFALTYLGTWRTLMKNQGWTEEKAKAIEKAYQDLYAVSLKWVDDQIKGAAQRGYAEGAFGLRIRTPLLKQTILGLRSTPREAQAESRTLGNAISGQSYGLLNNRAANAFMAKVWASKHRLSILPIAMIHDAIYLLIKDDLEVIQWVNRELVHEMEWQELPEIQHPEVHLGAELDIFWPSWAHPMTIPNEASDNDVISLSIKHIKEVA